MTDPREPPISGRRDVESSGYPTDPVDEPIVLEGEVVDEGTFRADRDFSSGQFGEAMNAPGGVGGMFGAQLGAGEIFRLLTGNQEVRALLTTPLRILSIAVLVPTLIAGLFGFAIDSGARILGFVLAGAGVLTAGLITARRRRIVRGTPSSTTHTSAPEPSRPARTKGLVSLVGLGMLLIMLGVGFDLLALLLLAFGVW